MAKSPFKYFRVDKNILNDPLMTTPQRIGYWIQLLALAKACNCNGALIDQFDKPMSLNQIQKLSRQRKNTIKFWIDNGKLTQKGEEWVIHNWAKYQDNYDRRIDKEFDKSPKVSPSDTESRKLLPDTERDTPTPKPTATPSPAVQAIFVDWFKIEFQARFGKPYADSKADYIQIAAVIKAYKGDIELLKRLVQKGWNTPDEKNFSLSSCCMTVKGFCTVVNRITLQKPKAKTAYELEQEKEKHENLPN